jgi:L-lactate utilization protein LutC
MSGAREAFLQRVRHAVAEGNRAGTAPGLPTRGTTGYQGAGPDVVAQFCAMVTASGGKAQLVDPQTAVARVLELIQNHAARRILLGRGPVLDSLQLSTRLQSIGLEVTVVDALGLAAGPSAFFAADLGISGVNWAIAEAGSLVMATGPHEPRSLSLLPPVHIAIVGRQQLVPDLFDLFADLQPQAQSLPSCVTLITGPSKTGDIELKLVTGVHGPRELHVLVLGE